MYGQLWTNRNVRPTGAAFLQWARTFVSGAYRILDKNADVPSRSLLQRPVQQRIRLHAVPAVRAVEIVARELIDGIEG